MTLYCLKCKKPLKHIGHDGLETFFCAATQYYGCSNCNTLWQEDPSKPANLVEVPENESDSVMESINK